MKRAIHITLLAAFTMLALAACDQVVGNGNSQASAPITLTAAGPDVASKTVSLGGSDTTTITLSWSTTDQNTGNQAAFESVKLFVDGSEVDSRSVTLNTGLAKELSFV